MPYRVCGLECGQRRALRRAAVSRCLHGCLVSVSGRSSWSSRLACGCVSGRRFLPTGSPLPEEPDRSRDTRWRDRTKRHPRCARALRHRASWVDVVARTIEPCFWLWSCESVDLACFTLDCDAPQLYTDAVPVLDTHLGVYSSDRTKRRPRRPRWRRRLCDCASLTWICECDVEQLYTDAALMLDASTRVVAAAGSGRASSTWHLHVSLASSTMQMAQQPS